MMPSDFPKVTCDDDFYVIQQRAMARRRLSYDLLAVPDECPKCGIKKIMFIDTGKLFRGHDPYVTAGPDIFTGPVYDTFLDRLCYKCKQCGHYVYVLPKDHHDRDQAL